MSGNCREVIDGDASDPANSAATLANAGFTLGAAGTNFHNQPGPTGLDETPFDVKAKSAGLYNFTLDYSECCGGRQT